MKYISWFRPSGRVHSRDQTALTEERAAQYADMLPTTIFFYTDENLQEAEK